MRRQYCGIKQTSVASHLRHLYPGGGTPGIPGSESKRLDESYDEAPKRTGTDALPRLTDVAKDIVFTLRLFKGAFLWPQS